MRRLSGALFSLALFGLLQANVLGQDKKEKTKETDKDKSAAAAPSLKHLNGRKIVFVANGAGGSTMAGENLMAVNSDMHLGLLVKPVAWCRKNSTKEDLLDQDAQLSTAFKIACWTKALRKDAPEAEIYYVGHSAGARVVLAAAEMAGAKSVDRIILLHAAVSQGYDLTAALKASRLGIDSFYATEDTVLERATETVGLADGIKAQAGGRLGFGPINPKDETYRNLRQYRWGEQYHGSGGHYAWVLQHNMKKVMTPLFFCR